MVPGGPTGPDDLRRLLFEAIDSFEKLELLLAIARAPAPPTTAALYAQLDLHEAPDDALAELAAAAVLAPPPPGWRLDDRGPWVATIAELCTLHEQDRTRVLELMTATSLERLRGSAARTFANAFLLRRPKKEDDHG